MMKEYNSPPLDSRVAGSVLLWVLFVLSVSVSALAKAETVEFDHLHSGWDALLKKHVIVSERRSTFQYALLLKNKAPLDQYLALVEAVSNEQFELFSKPEQLSFLINAYNAFTVKWILKHYPTKSIKNTTGLLSSPWKQEFFSLFGKPHHLDFIEHEMIRKKFSEPRIHFALVCAARSCPPLRNEAYRSETLEAQLADATSNFLNDPERNRYDSASSKLYLSKIFKWFRDDFTSSGKSVQEFVAPLMTTAPAAAANEDTAIAYLDYDWSLNDAS